MIDAALEAQLAKAVEAEGLRLVVAASATEAKDCLQKDENIVFIVGDLDDGMTLQQAIDATQSNRQHISWSRLPGLLLVPPGLVAHEEQLRASGVLADMLPKPVDADMLRLRIRRAQAR